jgi:hypothetical protein
VSPLGRREGFGIDQPTLALIVMVFVMVFVTITT